MRITIRPMSNPRIEIDVTERLVGALAEVLWRHGNANATLNWLEAERQLEHLILAVPDTTAPVQVPRMRKVVRGTRGRSRTARSRVRKGMER